MNYGGINANRHSMPRQQTLTTAAKMPPKGTISKYELWTINLICIVPQGKCAHAFPVQRSRMIDGGMDDGDAGWHPAEKKKEADGKEETKKEERENKTPPLYKERGGVSIWHLVIYDLAIYYLTSSKSTSSAVELPLEPLAPLFEVVWSFEVVWDCWACCWAAYISAEAAWKAVISSLL